MLITAKDLTVYDERRQRGGLTKSIKECLGRYLLSAKNRASVLQTVSCSFPLGSNIILGPSGGGKTTLLQVLAGQLLPSGGQVLVDGEVVDPGALRQVIGYLPQNFGFYPHVTGREMLHYIAVVKGIIDQTVRERNVEEVLQRMGLLQVAERKIGFYSKGMVQKVGIAQTLLGNPPVLILDEPTAGLDPEERNKLRMLLLELGQERVVIWTSSLLADANAVDAVLVMNQGQACFWGTPSQLATGNQNVAGQGLVGQVVDSDWAMGLEQGYRAILSGGVKV